MNGFVKLIKVPPLAIELLQGVETKEVELIFKEQALEIEVLSIVIYWGISNVKYPPASIGKLMLYLKV